MAEPLPILVLGSGPIQIGQAGEFDYAGAQALKALKERGFRTLLLNPNLASAQTLPSFADRVFVLPLTVESIQAIVAAERPIGLLAGFGGQSALNLALALEQTDLDLPVLGTSLATVRRCEDRQAFLQLCISLALPTPCAHLIPAGSRREDLLGLNFPLLHRRSFALGGQGARFYPDLASFWATWEPHLQNTPCLLEEDLSHWQEIEFEVMRDAVGNSLVVCALENIDPMGIHTGDSYVVAPPMTLSNDPYFALRAAALDLVNALDLIGECNVQFAWQPESGAFRVIELNPRLSRSSALASKATGYPIAYVAARLALGDLLPEIVNPLTGLTSCFFEPALDYVVVKAPRWQFEPFPGASRRLGPEMKSIGESMGIAEDFSTAFAKAWAMTQASQPSYPATWPMNRLREELARPSDQRMCAVFAAFQQGLKQEEIQALTGISSWFLSQFEAMSQDFYPSFKWPHYCCWGLRQIDCLAGEFPACSPYLYLSPMAEFHFGEGPWVLVLGSGPYGIGSSVEFDFCIVSGVQALQAAGYRVAVLNANPETLSSDYDLADALIFEPLIPESITAVVAALRPVGILASLGGQVPQNLLAVLPQHWPFWGTPVAQIRRAENRLSFAMTLDQLSLPQPPWSRTDNVASALAFGEKVGYPLIFRTAHVLGGGGMAVLEDPEALKSHFETGLSDLNGALLNRFLPEAREFELDGIARSGQLAYYLFSENVENAGIHSGDSHHLFPALQLTESERSQALNMAIRLVSAFEISGLFNLQFLSLEGRVLIIEANLRASRNLPFLSHVAGQNLIALAIRQLLSPTPLVDAPLEIPAQHVGIRAPAFSWPAMAGHEPILGVVMKATGEFCALAESEQLAWNDIYSHSGTSHTAVIE